MKKKFLILNIIMFALIITADIFYILKGGLLIKSIASSLFVIQAVLNLIFVIKKKTPKKFAIWLVIALIIALFGDVFINIKFIVGAIIFGIGHIFYFIAYCCLNKASIKDLIFAMCVFIPSLLIILFLPVLNFRSSIMFIVAIAYALIISFMLGKALSNFIKNRNVVNLIIFIGSLLFYISDFALMLDTFGSISFAGLICLLTYYPAQSVLASSNFIESINK